MVTCSRSLAVVPNVGIFKLEAPAFLKASVSTLLFGPMPTQPSAKFLPSAACHPALPMNGAKRVLWPDYQDRTGPNGYSLIFVRGQTGDGARRVRGLGFPFTLTGPVPIWPRTRLAPYL